MSQLSLFKEEDSSKKAAIHLIEVYVKRGDDIGSLKDMGASSPDSYWVEINGYIGDKHFGNEFIIVRRDMQGKEVNKKFKVKDIYNEIKEEMQNDIRQTNPSCQV